MKAKRIVLTLVLMLCFIVPISADEADSLDVPNISSHIDSYYEDLSENEEMYIEDNIVDSFTYVDEELVGTTYEDDSDPDGVSLRFIGQSIKTKVLPITTKVIYPKPEGQPKYGYDSSSDATVFFFDLKGTTRKAKISVTFQKKAFSTTFEYTTGTVSASGSGYGAKVPSGKGWIFNFVQTHRIEPTKVDYYVGNKYRNTVILSKSLGYSLSHRWVKS